MCGIAGLLRPHGGPPVEPDRLMRMAGVLGHRGPDDSGVWHRGTFGLAHRRLSVIDLEGGHQPMTDPSGRYTAVYNGEIYNFQELRAELEAAGYTFQTNCDTEVLLIGYAEWGEDLPRRLRGMFAFAVADIAERRLFAARDRLGQKPFYYTYNPATGELSFASEIKALLATKAATGVVDPAALIDYLIYQYVPGDRTLVRGVRRLPPAHSLRWYKGRVNLTRYWSVQYQPKLELDAGEARSAMESALEDAVKARLIADVPLGCFLSGGLDSSAVALMMARHAPGAISTFSIGFPEHGFDETPYARLVAEHLGADHHEEIVRPSAAETFGLLAWHLDDLMGDVSAIPQFYLARLARRHVTVALSGDGGDESLGGYERYRGGGWRWFAERCVCQLLAAAGGSVVRASGAASGRLMKYAEAARVIGAGPDAAYGAAMTICWPEILRRVLHPDIVSTVEDEALANRATIGALDGGGAREELDRYMSSDLHTYLPGDLLVKVDRMTMAHGLEARSPFLDHRLVEFAARLPPDLKFRAGRLKAILKDILLEHFPPDLVNRPKAGFAVPIDSWFRGPLRPWLEALLLEEPARSRGFLNPAGVRWLIEDHARSAKGHHGHRLWLLALFELWCRTFVDLPGDAPIDPGISAGTVL